MRYLLIVLLLTGFSSIPAIAENETPVELTQQPAVAEQPSKLDVIPVSEPAPTSIAQPPGISGDPVKPQGKKNSDEVCRNYGYDKGTEEYNQCIDYAEAEGYVGENDNGRRKKKRR